MVPVPWRRTSWAPQRVRNSWLRVDSSPTRAPRPGGAASGAGEGVGAVGGLGEVQQVGVFGVVEPEHAGAIFDLTLPLDQVAEGYKAMDERRAIKTPLPLTHRLTVAGAAHAPRPRPPL
ncbi:hypothetical protein [Streptomyces sp. NPDC055400]